MSVLLRYPIRGKGASELAASVERALREGRIAAGEPLPTVRALARELGVSPATVASAYRTLRQRGLAAGDGRRGTRVGPRPPVAPERPDPPPPLGLRDLASGNPDPALLPGLPPFLLRAAERTTLYGEPAEDPELLRLAAAQLDQDGIDGRSLAVVGGALDGIERVLQAHSRPGDRVAVEDPGYAGVLDLVAALGLSPEPVQLDESGPLPEALERALRRNAVAVVLTPRAQNPAGAALDAGRTRELRRVLRAFPDTLVVEDDHAGPVAGAEALSVAHGRRRFSVVRSVSKWLGPDLRLSLLAGDAETVARVRGRQRIGAGWVSHILQRLVALLWQDAATAGRIGEARRAYALRRAELIAALARHGVPAFGRSGLNVWVPVREEASATLALAGLGWGVRAGERYRIGSPPAIRVTAAALRSGEAERLAADVARSLGPGHASA